MKGLRWKLDITFLGIADILLFLPQRLFRLIQHFFLPADRIYREVYPRTYSLFWGFEFVVRLVEILGIGELYNILSCWLKFNTRALDRREVVLSRTIFGEKFPLYRVCIDEWAMVGPPQRHICYVSFWTVNSWRSMSDCLLIHELVHTWQYHRLGMVYILRALVAQRSKQGYDYGGTEALREVYLRLGKMDEFNLEQQADIVADYCRIKKGLGPAWGKGSWVDLPLYQYFVDQLI